MFQDKPMSIESEIFKRFTPDFEKLIKYGFSKDRNSYVIVKHFSKNDFLAKISVSPKGKITGVVYDNENGDEYLPLRLEYNEGAFVGEIKTEYEKILTDIRKNCFTENYFVTSQANRIAQNIIEKYGDSPVFMWEKFPTYGVFKNGKNNKWYGIIMYIERAKLDNHSEDKVEVINLKLNKDDIFDLCKKDGIYPAWHMNKKYWVSVTLDDTLPDDEVMKYIEESYSYTVVK